MLSRVLVIGLLLCGTFASPSWGAAAEDLAEVTRLHHAGQTAAALERAERALASNPKDAQLRFLKSVLLADTGRTAEAQAILQHRGRFMRSSGHSQPIIPRSRSCASDEP